MFLSEKKLNDMEESDLFTKIMLEIQDDKSGIAPSNDKKLQQEQQREIKDEEEDNKCNTGLLNFVESKLEDDFNNQDVLKTPKSPQQKIPMALTCPPAPKKPKSLPAKRKASSRQLIYLDFSSEVEAMFSRALHADLGKKIKKARQES